VGMKKTVFCTRRENCTYRFAASIRADNEGERRVAEVDHLML
jgi:hypothetical protein